MTDGQMACQGLNQEQATVFCGTFIHSTATNPLEIFQDHVLGVANGKIVFLAPKERLEELMQKHGFEGKHVRVLTKYQFLMPGLIDTHIHAPQYVYTGTGLDLPLLQWLERYTFPVEARFTNIKFATDAYRKVVRRTLDCGTTTALYFATNDKDSSLKLAEIAADLGQRAFVGKVNADQNVPDYYKESTDQSLQDTEWFIERVKELSNPLVAPVVTPRFAISCSEKLMRGLGDIAKNYDVHIQSHISENRDEVQMIKELFPDFTNYTDVYDKCGLMTNKTVMAHCIYLDDSEIEVFKQRGSAMAHCPCSNFSLTSGVMDCRKMKESGVKLGLGTDVSGGYTPSMLGTIRNTITASNTRAIMAQPDNDYRRLSYKQVFQLATLGGSQALGIDDRVGNFEVGKEFDALLVDLKAEGSQIDIFESEYTDTLENMIEKFFFLGDDRNVVEVFVCGRRVKSVNLENDK